MIAPDSIPQFLRIFAYCPLAINCFSAASSGFVIPVPFGTAMPYGARDTANDWVIECTAALLAP